MLLTNLTIQKLFPDKVISKCMNKLDDDEFRNLRKKYFLKFVKIFINKIKDNDNKKYLKNNTW